MNLISLSREYDNRRNDDTDNHDANDKPKHKLQEVFHCYPFLQRALVLDQVDHVCNERPQDNRRRVGILKKVLPKLEHKFSL